MATKKQAPAKKPTSAKEAAKPASKATAKKSAKSEAAPKKRKAPAKKTSDSPKKSAPAPKAATAKKTSKPKKKASAKKKTAPTKKAASTKQTVEKVAKVVAKTPARTATSKMTQTESKKKVAAKARVRTRSQRASTFTLDDAKKEIKRSAKLRAEEEKKNEAVQKLKEAEAAKKKLLEEPPEPQSFEAASLADILGFNPVNDEEPANEESTIPKKFKPYYKLLVELRAHVTEGLDLHTEETLKRSTREDSGDLSGYGQHMADAGTDNFDRDFALSLVSNEQEALYEVDEAIKRIKNGTYGICELTGKPIDKERLLAVPFARYSVNSQAEVEKVKKRSAQRGGAFGDVGDDGPKLIEESDD